MNMKLLWARILVITLLITAGVSALSNPAQAALSPYAGSDGQLDVLTVGDSLTRGQGDPMWGGYRLDLRARLANAGQSPDMVGPWIAGNGDHQHGGTSGARIDQINVQIPQLVSQFAPDVVIVMVGTNDVGQHWELDTVQARMVTLLGRVRTYRPSARVFAVTIPQWRDSPWVPTVAQVNAGITGAVSQMADPKITVIPGSIVGTDTARDFASDGIHLSPCGYAKMAFVIWTYLGLSDVKPAGDTWLGGYWPWSNTGVCA